MDIVSPLLCLIAGGCGYLAVTFWMQPILRYIQIRFEVTSDVVFYANVINPRLVNDRLKERHEAGSEAHRRHAAEIVACFYRLPRWYRFILRRRGEDPLTASRNLVGLSNCSNAREAEPYVRFLKESLRIPQENGA